MASKLNLKKNESHKKILVIRLSSLGDVILATSALGPLQMQRAEVTWVVSKGFESVLQGHPLIDRLVVFDRSTGLTGWLALFRLLSQERWHAVLDLHVNLRTQIWRGLWLHSLHRPQWVTAPKQYWRRSGLFAFKKLWPKRWYPHLRAEVAARAAGGTGREGPDLRWMVAGMPKAVNVFPQPYWIVMPSSAWSGKCWPVGHYVEFFKKYQGQIFPVVVGLVQDRASVELAERLRSAEIPYASKVGEKDLVQTAYLLAGAEAYFGSDTGLFHLAEALGVRSYVFFGPTLPEIGFGPRLSDSRPLQKPMFCRPCSLDGRGCFRQSRYACLKELTVDKVEAQLFSHDRKEDRHVALSDET